MASLFKASKAYKIQLAIGGRRRTITLGEVDKTQAQEWMGLIVRLHDCYERKLRPDQATRLQRSALPASLQKGLQSVGLQETSRVLSVADLCHYITTEMTGSKSTLIKRQNVAANLIAHFGPDRPIDAILPGDADEFRRWLAREGGRGSTPTLARATVSRRCAMAKSWFQTAIRKGWLRQNPFEDQKRESEANETRTHFVARDVIDRLFEGCADPHFRLVLALARYGGLRIPSEVAGLRWEWFDWDRQVMHVRAPKTKHLENKGIRTVPIFPEIRPHLECVWELAPAGAVEVFESISCKSSTLTNRLHTLCRNCHVDPWGKPWQNMRSTRETELVEAFPIHVATAWIGNSVAVASKHYLQVTKEHYDAALVEPRAANSHSETPRAANALHSAPK